MEQPTQHQPPPRPPAPGPPARATKPFAQQAAMISWLAPLIAFGLSCGTMPLKNQRPGPGDDEFRGLALLMLAGVEGFLILTGFVCAIIALVGVRKHGAKGILIPGLIGLVISGGLLVLVAVGFVLFATMPGR